MFVILDNMKPMVKDLWIFYYLEIKKVGKVDKIGAVKFGCEDVIMISRVKIHCFKTVISK